MKRQVQNITGVAPPPKRTKTSANNAYVYRTLPTTTTATTTIAFCQTCKLGHARLGSSPIHPAVAYLLAQGGNEDNQKSDAWLRARCSKATGTFFASCLPKNHSNFNAYSPRTCAFLEKLNLALPFKGNDATRHGVRFEDTALEVYRQLVNNDTVQSFGLLSHSYVSWLGGSPDGVTNGGIVLEVKCPYYRWLKKESLYPAYYYPQPQLIMDIVGLEVAHFIQFKPPVIRKKVVGTKQVRDRYTQQMKAVNVYEKVYEDNVARMLEHGHDETKYVEPLIISVVEVLRNRRFFHANVKHVDALWKEIVKVYKDNLVPLGDANMIRALYADRMSLAQYVVRLHLAFRLAGLPVVDYVGLVRQEPTLRDMSTVLIDTTCRLSAYAGAPFKAMREEITRLRDFYRTTHNVSELADLNFEFSGNNPPPYYAKKSVAARLSTYPNLNVDVRRLTRYLHLDAPVVENVASFCLANNIPYKSVKVTDDAQEPVTERAFDVDAIKTLLKRKSAVPLAENLLDFTLPHQSRVEPASIGTTIYYRCGGYVYNPQRLKPTNLGSFGSRHGLPMRPQLPKRTAVVAVAQPRQVGVAQPPDMMAQFRKAQQQPSQVGSARLSASRQVGSARLSASRQVGSARPSDMMQLYQQALKRQANPAANRMSIARAPHQVGSARLSDTRKVGIARPMDMMQLYEQAQKH